MTEKVRIIIEGMQSGDPDTAIITRANGSYHLTMGWHYVLYDEQLGEGEAVSKNIMKLKQDRIELTKKGLGPSHMVFDRRERTRTLYATPYGDIPMEIETREIRIKEATDRIEVELDYLLYTADSLPIENKIMIWIEAEKA